MLALPGGIIRFFIFAESSAAKNLVRDSRLTITLALDGGMSELMMHVRPLPGALAEANLTAFEAKVETVRFHKAPYADVTTGVTFSLHDPETVLSRW